MTSYIAYNRLIQTEIFDERIIIDLDLQEKNTVIIQCGFCY
jgi:hypothetical protein